MQDQAVTDSQFVIVDFEMPLTNGHISSSGLWQMQVQFARSKNKCIQTNVFVTGETKPQDQL